MTATGSLFRITPLIWFWPTMYSSTVKTSRQSAARYGGCCVPAASFLGSAYGSDHMKEISQLVQEFDSRIVLSAEETV